MNDVSRSIIRLVTAYNTAVGSIQAAYTFDAGPNAVIYCKEAHAVELAALFLHYFPTTTAADYLNRPELLGSATQHTLDANILAACDRVASVHEPGQVQRMYYTRSGTGPKLLTDECNIDPVTGLNTYQPAAK